jgi:Flp pilus assembly protein TadG
MNALARVAASLCLGSRVRHQIGSVRTCIQRSDERGSTLIELALCIPILLMIVTGITSIGFALNNYLMLTNSVQIGARQLAILSGQTTDPCLAVSSTISAASPLLRSANLSYTFTINGTAYTGTTCTAGAARLLEGTSATVQVTYPCSLIIYGKNLVPSCTLSAQTTELVQ